MELIEAAIQSPFDNLLGVFIYFTAVIVVTLLILTLLLYIIPNPLSRRLRSTIMGIITLIVIFIWVRMVFF